MSIDKRFEMCEQLRELEDKIETSLTEEEGIKKRMKTLKSKIERYDVMKREEENKTFDNIFKNIRDKVEAKIHNVTGEVYFRSK